MRTHIITCANRTRYRAVLDRMYRQRHDVFVEKLGWLGLASPSQRDIDDYDDDDAVYLVALEQAEVVGSLRLLPSWRRSLLRDKFAAFVDGELPVGPDIWEWTRWAPFCERTTGRLLIQTRAALIGAAIEFAVSRRASMFTAVCDPKFIGQLLELGWRPEPLGLPTRYPEGTAIALKWPVDAEDIPILRRVLKLKGPAAVEAPMAALDDAYDLESFAALAGVGLHDLSSSDHRTLSLSN